MYYFVLSYLLDLIYLKYQMNQSYHLYLKLHFDRRHLRHLSYLLNYLFLRYQKYLSYLSYLSYLMNLKYHWYLMIYLLLTLH